MVTKEDMMACFQHRNNKKIYIERETFRRIGNKTYINKRKVGRDKNGEERSERLNDQK